MRTADHMIVESSIPSVELTPRAKAFARIMAVTRISVGWVFLWSFLDKTFGLGFSTASESAWVNGGSPATGWLQFGAADSPAAGMFSALAGMPGINFLYMFAMLGMGLALVLGIGLRVNAVAGSVVVVMMWLGSLPYDTNPFFTYHLLYALLFVAFAVGAVGNTWGLGARWERTALVQKAPWLK
jgi:thiosulfate dehydrogenase (quinone) large subunit